MKTACLVVFVTVKILLSISPDCIFAIEFNFISVENSHNEISGENGTETGSEKPTGERTIKFLKKLKIQREVLCKLIESSPVAVSELSGTINENPEHTEKE
ncbi:MAG: hypothetical protein Q8M08_06045 [Bacteroidales bacterium]|nr:hypothetical protein [Bacteroidales bacterium]